MQSFAQRRCLCSRHATETRPAGATARVAIEPWRKTDALPHSCAIDQQVAEMNALEHIVDLALQQHPHRRMLRLCASEHRSSPTGWLTQ
jgi:hypothetical protein